MEKIESFKIDHTILPRGMYVSRIDGDVITYDIRMRLPNKEEVMQNAAMHTIEHLFATFARNKEFAKSVIYFGPMGCRTGFYFLLRDNVSKEDAIRTTVEAFDFIRKFDREVPGMSAKECGNYRDHDLEGAKKEAEMMYEVLKDWKESQLVYPEK